MQSLARNLIFIVLWGFSTQNLSAQLAIRGVKWKNEMIGTDAAASPRFETEGLTYTQAAQGLAANGVTEVVLKVAEQSIMPAGTTVAQIHIEVVNMVAALKAAGVRVYLWQRQWLQRAGSINSGAEDFASEFKLIIDRAKTAGVDDNIVGISLIENNLETSAQVLSQALSIASKINNKTNNWLRTKTFLFPGAAMGGYFKGIHTATGNTTFFSSMNTHVAAFSFIYKHMRSQDVDVCSLGSLNTEWGTNVGKSSPLTIAQQANYINTNMGLSDLATFLNAYRTTYPNLCNVTFWGDSGDGLFQMSNSNILAVHKVMVQDRDWKGYFFDMAYTNHTTTGSDLKKFILKVTNGVISKNLSPNAVNTTTVWNEWDRWQHDSYVVPVELVDFKGKYIPPFEGQFAGSLLTWRTASEINNSHFEIERSDDGSHFEKIGTVKGNGTTQTTKHYQFLDNRPKTLQYYRLRQVDFDGKNQLSNTVSIKAPVGNFGVKITPSVSNHFLSIEMPFEQATAVVSDILGRILVKQTIANGQTIDISQLATGHYILLVESKSANATARFFKN